MSRDAREDISGDCLTSHVGTRIHSPLISREADAAKDPGPCPEVSLETSEARLLTDHVGTRIHPRWTGWINPLHAVR